jgi:hypothetical protein
VAQEDQEVNVKDLRLPAINAVRLIQCPSSLQRVDQSYAAIVLARVVRRNKEPEKFVPTS